ncbi:MAG: DinB family protein [Phycisphaeraceae bacterium]|nr:DinB family protein [Phycisphaeraceae bacterium]
MNPLRTYHYLVLARQKILDWSRLLSPEQHAQQFPIGLGSLARILTHIMICEWFYIQRLQGLAVPPYKEWPIRDETPPRFEIIEQEWKTIEAQTRAAIGSVDRAGEWGEVITYMAQRDDGKRVEVSATKGDILTQLVLHEVHHRAQAMNILRHLGVKVEDIDYNAMMYTRRELP